MARSSDHRTRWLSPFAIWFLLLWIGLTVAGRDRMFRDPGTLWHTVVGQRILSSGELIRSDPFSFTFAGKPWIAQQWLAECIMAVFHRLAGLDGLLLLAAALLAATYASIADRLTARGLSTIGAAVIVALLLGASSYHFHARPHVVTIAFSAWVFALLSDVEAGRIHFRRLWLLPPAIVVWSNLHGGALGGVVTICAALAGWAAVMIFLPPRSIRGVGLLAAIGIASLLAIFVNPFGLQLPRVWLSLMNSPVLPRIIQEHGPLEFGSAEGLMLLSMAALYLGLLMDAARQVLRITWLIPALWLVLAVARVRHGPIFAVLAAIAIAEMLPYSFLVARLKRMGSAMLSNAPIPARPGPRRGWIAAALVGVVLACQWAGIRVPVLGAGWARLSDDYWPVDATAALARTTADQSPPVRVFNQMTFGGYLIYSVPEVKIYIDDRCELYGDAFLSHYESILRDPASLDRESRQWDFDLAIVSSRSRLAIHLTESAAWQCIHRDETASLFQRR